VTCTFEIVANGDVYSKLVCHRGKFRLLKRSLRGLLWFVVYVFSNCSTYYKAVYVCFITAGPIIKLCAGGVFITKVPCVFITAVPITKLFARGGGGNGGHVLRETTSRGRC
jgi:hypothetical protein